MTVRCGTCGEFMGTLAPLDRAGTILGLCGPCACRSRSGGGRAEWLIRGAVSLLDGAITRADASALRWLAGELARLQGDAAAAVRPHTLRAPVAARRAQR